MGIDVSGVSGYGIDVTEEDLRNLVENGHFTEEEFEEDLHECVASFLASREDGVTVYLDVAGSYYSGNFNYYLSLNYSKPEDLISHTDEFLNFIEKYFNVKKVKEDLYFFTDYVVF